MKQKKRIILLTGPKHSGKTTVGRILAPLLEGEFTDLDELIETQTNTSPRELYHKGALIFRDAEFKALKSLLVPAGAAGQGPVRVIAAGGGIIDNPPAMACAAQAEGILLVCLELSPETAWKRICRAAEQTKEMPPFLMTENPRETHRALHERRAAAYRQIAGMVVLAEQATAETTAREIAKRFQEYR